MKSTMKWKNIIKKRRLNSKKVANLLPSSVVHLYAIITFLIFFGFDVEKLYIAPSIVYVLIVSKYYLDKLSVSIMEWANRYAKK